jgi:hypothetical protein
MLAMLLTLCRDEAPVSLERRPTVKRFREELNDLMEREAKQRRNRTAWLAMYYAVGVPASLLAALAGLGSLSNFISRDVVGWIAIASALAAALNVHLRPRVMSQRANAKAKGYRKIAASMESQVALWEEIPPKDATEVYGALGNYLQQRTELDERIATAFDSTE